MTRGSSGLVENLSEKSIHKIVRSDNDTWRDRDWLKILSEIKTILFIYSFIIKN